MHCTFLAVPSFYCTFRAVPSFYCTFRAVPRLTGYIPGTAVENVPSSCVHSTITTPIIGINGGGPIAEASRC